MLSSPGSVADWKPQMQRTQRTPDAYSCVCIDIMRKYRYSNSSNMFFFLFRFFFKRNIWTSFLSNFDSPSLQSVNYNILNLLQQYIQRRHKVVAGNNLYVICSLASIQEPNCQHTRLTHNQGYILTVACSQATKLCLCICPVGQVWTNMMHRFIFTWKLC